MATGEQFTAAELKNCLFESLLANIKDKIEFVFRKNVTDSELDGAVGRVWLKPQDLQSLPLKKPKGRNRLPVEGKDGGEGKRKEGAEGWQAQAGGAKKRRKQRD